VYLDEAFHLSTETMGALMPALSARPNPQVWYTSSAPHASSDVLHSVRRRGLAGDARERRPIHERLQHASLDEHALAQVVVDVTELQVGSVTHLVKDRRGGALGAARREGGDGTLKVVMRGGRPEKGGRATHAQAR
jgi:hypothetical protein